MTYIPRSSFSMKESAGPIPKLVQKKHTFRVFSFVGALLLVVSIAAALGTFFYKEYSTKQLENAKVALGDAGNNELDQKNMKEIAIFDRRLDAAQFLIKNHRAPSRVLQKLEGITKETVQLKSFEYTYDPGFEVLVELSGTTKELSSVALQKIEIMNNDLFSEFLVSDIVTGAAIPSGPGASVVENEATEGVMFGVKGTLKDREFDYEGVVLGGAPEPSVPEVVTDEAVPNEVTQ